MIGACRLNNKSMRNIRRNEIYQCLAIDLAMLGVISKEECEILIGSGIPKNLLLPNGKPGELVSEESLPKQPEFIQTEPEKEPEQTPETPETPESDEPQGVQETGDETPDAEGEETPEVTDDEGRTESDN